MGRHSKLDEGAWGALFALERAGASRGGLAERFGVTVAAIAWQARRRGLAVDRRRRPVGGWAPDHVFAQSRSAMTPERWMTLLARRNLGVADAVLAAEHGVHVDTIARAARRMGLRKTDVAGAVMRPRGPGWTRGPARPELGFAIDPHDAEVHRRGIMAAIQRAAHDERVADLRALLRFWSELEWFYPEAGPFRPGGGGGGDGGRGDAGARSRSQPRRGPC